MPQPIAPLHADVSPAIAALLNEAVDCATLADGLVVAERALALAENGTSLDRAAAAHVTCFFLYRTGATEHTITFGESMLPLIRAEPMLAAYAEVLRWVGVCACDSGLFGVAIKRASEGYRLADEMNDQRGRVLAFSLLGGCFERAGDPWQGERLLRDGLALARELNEPYPLITTINNLAAVLIGKFYSLRDGWAATEARAALDDCLPLAREVLKMAPVIGDPYLDAFAHGNLGEVLKKELFIFLEANPDLKEEFENFEMIFVPAPAKIFPDKDRLKKNTISRYNYKTWFVGYLEDDLDSNGKRCQYSPPFSTRTGWVASPVNAETARSQNRCAE